MRSELPDGRARDLESASIGVELDPRANMNLERFVQMNVNFVQGIASSGKNCAQLLRSVSYQPTTLQSRPNCSGVVCSVVREKR